ncbi:phosphopantetheine-binding protein [Hymenobacter sp. DH14]|uniref:Phosphopantetheine-binding protein n=1 Tax=Hymenobacter cyanobacteriorum TaxID=2926463 RepID=A0A9X2AFD8_9BACT|nr:phosphopantetheine-binding protein [Hymenobacter cyanobacteriorum]MCI1186383.1 phosphopantetheine-binding protein [Hymenobacter cyanobacteriorum]
MDALKQQLKELLVEHLNLKDVKPEAIADDQPIFGEGLGLDSIDALEIIVMLQQHFGIRLTKADNGPQVLATVNSMADYITTHRK